MHLCDYNQHGTPSKGVIQKVDSESQFFINYLTILDFNPLYAKWEYINHTTCVNIVISVTPSHLNCVASAISVTKIYLKGGLAHLQNTGSVLIHCSSNTHTCTYK